MKFKVTIIIESDEDPSAIMDEFEHLIESGEIALTRLDHDAVEDGVAITVEDQE